MNENRILVIALIMLCMVPALAEAELPHIDIKNAIQPTEIWASDSINSPDLESSKITLTVTGDGNPFTIIRPIDIIFAIDSSGSMSNNDPDKHRVSAAQEFIDKVNPYKDKVGMVSWNGDVVFDLLLTNDFSRAKQAVAEVGSDDGTDLNKGLARSIDILLLQPRTSTKAIIFLSDGDGDYTPSGMDGSETDRARSADILIYSIGLGNEINGANLEDMAETTGGKYFFSPKSSSLEEIYQGIFKSISNIAARNIEVTYVLPAAVQPFGSIPEISTDANSNRILKWNIGLLAIDESWDTSFYVRSKDVGTFTLGANSSAEYINYAGKSAIASIIPATILVKRPMKIGDRIWVDKNGNGTQDPDEKGKEGLVVALLDFNKNPTGLTATTDANGNYQFNILKQGTYYIQFTIPGGYILSPHKQGKDIEKDCNFGSDGIAGPVILTGMSNNSIDAGLIPNDCISGQVWIDANKNGLEDNNEKAVSGANVTLLDHRKNSMGFINSTEINGNYRFDRLEPGPYYVQFKAPNGSVLSPQMLSKDAKIDLYPGSYGVAGPIILTDSCDNSVDMAIIPLCMNGIFVKENSGDDLINYSVLIRLSDANFPVMSDNEVIRIFFTSSSGRPLPYWIEEWNVRNKTAKVWVKMPFIPANKEAEILFQYYTEDRINNKTENPHGSGKSVFEFFDDFSGNGIDTGSWTTYTQSNGSVKQRDGMLQIHTNAKSQSSADLILKEDFGPGNAMRFRANISEGQSYDRKGLGFMNTNVGKDTNQVGASVYWRGQDTDLFAHHIFPISEKNILDVKIQRAKSNYEGSFNTWEAKWLDSEVRFGLNSQEFRQDTSGKPLGGISPRFSLNTTLTSLSSDIFVDWVFVRRCIAKEPTTRFGQKICMN
jgi:hypothetical protein